MVKLVRRTVVLRHDGWGARRRAKNDRISSRAPSGGWPSSSMTWAVTMLCGHGTWRAKLEDMLRAFHGNAPFVGFPSVADFIADRQSIDRVRRGAGDKHLSVRGSLLN
jgi:hypothetical protein